MRTSSIHFIGTLLVGMPNPTEPNRPRSSLGKDPRHVAHLAAGPRLALAIEVDGGAGQGGELAPFLDIRSNQIGHYRIAMARSLAKRPAANGPDVILELADGTGIERPMA